MSHEPLVSSLLSAAAVFTVTVGLLQFVPSLSTEHKLRKLNPLIVSRPKKLKKLLDLFSKLSGSCFKQSQRQRLIDRQLMVVLPSIISSLKAGCSLIQALEAAAQEVANPLSFELSRTVQEYKAGIPLHEALLRLGKRVSDSNVRYLSQVLLIHHRTGGELIHMLISLMETIKERAVLRNDLLAKTVESRLTARFILLVSTSLMLFMFAFQDWMLEPLLSTTLGRIGLAYSLVSWTVGLALIYKMLKIPELD